MTERTTSPDEDAYHEQWDDFMEGVEAYDRLRQEMVEARDAVNPWADIPDDRLGENIRDHLRIVGLLVMRLEARHEREKEDV